jgi:hypothetical protein
MYAGRRQAQYLHGDRHARADTAIGQQSGSPRLAAPKPIDRDDIETIGKLEPTKAGIGQRFIIGVDLVVGKFGAPAEFSLPPTK